MTHRGQLEYMAAFTRRPVETDYMHLLRQYMDECNGANYPELEPKQIAALAVFARWLELRTEP